MSPLDSGLFVQSATQLCLVGALLLTLGFVLRQLHLRRSQRENSPRSETFSDSAPELTKASDFSSPLAEPSPSTLAFPLSDGSPLREPVITDSFGSADRQVVPPPYPRIEAESGVEATVHDEVCASDRWFVSNGSRNLGPLNPPEIAEALYCLEIDFDSECWKEGSETRTMIAGGKVFESIGEFRLDADYWVFDGRTIYGPVTEKWLQSQEIVSRFGSEIWICKGSTTQGWARYADLKIACPDSQPKAKVTVRSQLIPDCSQQSGCEIPAPLESLPVLEVVEKKKKTA